jgi:hypothetical protein
VAGKGDLARKEDDLKRRPDFNHYCRRQTVLPSACL